MPYSKNPALAAGSTKTNEVKFESGEGQPAPESRYASLALPKAPPQGRGFTVHVRTT
jgi:hypothetical protein